MRRSLPILICVAALAVALAYWNTGGAQPAPVSPNVTGGETERVKPAEADPSTPIRNGSDVPAPEAERVGADDAGRAARVVRYFSLLPQRIEYGSLTDPRLAAVDVEAIRRALAESGVSAADIRLALQDPALVCSASQKQLAMLGMAWAEGFGSDERDYLGGLASRSNEVFAAGASDSDSANRVFVATHVLLLRGQLGDAVVGGLEEALRQRNDDSGQPLIGSAANFVQMVLSGASHDDPAAMAIAGQVLDGLIGNHPGAADAFRLLMAADPDAACERLLRSTDGTPRLVSSAPGFAALTGDKGLAIARNVMWRAKSERALLSAAEGCALAALASEDPVAVRDGIAWLEDPTYRVRVEMRELVKQLPPEVVLRCELAWRARSGKAHADDDLGRSLSVALDSRLDPSRMLPRRRALVLDELRRSVRSGAGGKRGVERCLELMARVAGEGDVGFLQEAGAQWGLDDQARLAIEAIQRRGR